jgi:hypothetical protein
MFILSVSILLFLLLEVFVWFFWRPDNTYTTGFIVVSLSFFLLFYTLESFIGASPVHFLGLGGSSGMIILLVNLVCYGLLSIIMALPALFVMESKTVYSKGMLTGTVHVSVYHLMLILTYLAIWWE